MTCLGDSVQRELCCCVNHNHIRDAGYQPDNPPNLFDNLVVQVLKVDKITLASHGGGASWEPPDASSLHASNKTVSSVFSIPPYRPVKPGGFWSPGGLT